jgi:hypothetical protein
MSVTLATRIKRDEEIAQNAFRALLMRAGVLFGWIVLIAGICLTVLLLQ